MVEGCRGYQFQSCAADTAVNDSDQVIDHRVGLLAQPVGPVGDRQRFGGHQLCQRGLRRATQRVIPPPDRLVRSVGQRHRSDGAAADDGAPMGQRAHRQQGRTASWGFPCRAQRPGACDHRFIGGVGDALDRAGNHVDAQFTGHRPLPMAAAVVVHPARDVIDQNGQPSHRRQSGELVAHSTDLHGGDDGEFARVALDGGDTEPDEHADRRLGVQSLIPHRRASHVRLTGGAGSAATAVTRGPDQATRDAYRARCG